MITGLKLWQLLGPLRCGKLLQIPPSSEQLLASREKVWHVFTGRLVFSDKRSLQLRNVLRPALKEEMWSEILRLESLLPRAVQSSYMGVVGCCHIQLSELSCDDRGFTLRGFRLEELVPGVGFVVLPEDRGNGFQSSWGTQVVGFFPKLTQSWVDVMTEWNHLFLHVPLVSTRGSGLNVQALASGLCTRPTDQTTTRT